MRRFDVALIAGAVILVFLLVLLLGGSGMMGPGMMGWGGYGFGAMGWLGMLLFWALIIGGIVFFASWLMRGGVPAWTGPTGPSQALEILKERYARGEITREQYEDMKHAIEER